MVSHPSKKASLIGSQIVPFPMLRPVAGLFYFAMMLRDIGLIRLVAASSPGKRRLFPILSHTQPRTMIRKRSATKEFTHYVEEYV